MKRSRLLLAFGALATLFLAAAPASAGDLCMQFEGASCPLSGDLGFFRFMGVKPPKTITKPAEVHGRACGFGVVTGTLVMSHDGNNIVLGANFVCDATAGAITAYWPSSFLLIPGTPALMSYASYGDVNLGNECSAIIVDCATEP